MSARFSGSYRGWPKSGPKGVRRVARHEGRLKTLEAMLRQGDTVHARTRQHRRSMVWDTVSASYRCGGCS